MTEQLTLTYLPTLQFLFFQKNKIMWIWAGCKNGSESDLRGKKSPFNYCIPIKIQITDFL